MRFQTQYAGRAPLDLIGAADDPERLMQALESFIEYWFGERHPDFGIAPGRVENLALPQPLKRLYAFAGQWPADNYSGRMLATGRVFLQSLESLWIEDDKLVFAGECDGGPWWATELGGSDPSVWSRSSDHGSPWNPLCDSLSSFLVTFCLRAAIAASNHYGSGENLIEYFRSRDLFVVPIWTHRPISCRRDHDRLMEFHLAGGRVLIENNHSCTTNCEQIAERFPDVFRPASEPELVKTAIWNHPYVPRIVLELSLKRELRNQERLASEYEDRAAQHARLAEFFRGKLESLPTNEQKP